jgi:hypothetical protein
MPSLRVPIAGCLLVATTLAVAVEAAEVERLMTLADRAGLRLLEGERLVLATDRPPRDGDGVADLPGIFDQAFAAWCRHYGVSPESLRGWRAFGCLVVDRERFRAAGLLPAGIPEFTNGFCDRDRFWLVDQSNPAYRRHLLLHEGVHAFTITVRDLAAPPWYTEGIAEYLATHRLDPASGGRLTFVPTPLPDHRGDVEQLGRIERIRSARKAAAAPGLAEVFATPPGVHRDVSAYASSWAAVAMLARHPAHAVPFAAAERGPLDGTFTERLAAEAGWDGARAERDFDAFTDELDYGFDFARSAIDWSPGRTATDSEPLAVDAARGWQNSGLALAKGDRHALVAEGRVTIGSLPEAPGRPTTLESEADGISLRWYRGRPVGRLLAAQWVEEPPGGGRPRFVVLGEGARTTLTAAVDGPLYLKLNESPGDLADNAGTFRVTLELAETPAAP